MRISYVAIKRRDLWVFITTALAALAAQDDSCCKYKPRASTCFVNEISITFVASKSSFVCSSTRQSACHSGSVTTRPFLMVLDMILAGTC